MLPDLVAALAKPVASTALVGIAMALSWQQKLGLEAEMIIAAARAFVQLFAVGFVLEFIFSRRAAAWWIAAAYLFMVSVAGFTAGVRAKLVPHAKLIAGASIFIGTSFAVLVVALTQALPFTPAFIVPSGGMMVGAAMTATAVTMKKLQEDVRLQSQMVEAALALGARPRQASLPQAVRAVGIAMAPDFDTYRTAGLIVLPGTLMGLIMGGASPVNAVKLQMVVICMNVGAGAVSSMASVCMCRGTFFTKACQLNSTVFSRH